MEKKYTGLVPEGKFIGSNQLEPISRGQLIEVN